MSVQGARISVYKKVHVMNCYNWFLISKVQSCHTWYDNSLIWWTSISFRLDCISDCARTFIFRNTPWSWHTPHHYYLFFVVHTVIRQPQTNDNQPRNKVIYMLVVLVMSTTEWKPLINLIFQNYRSDPSAIVQTSLSHYN
jgi:hypothetical protein